MLVRVRRRLVFSLALTLLACVGCDDGPPPVPPPPVPDAGPPGDGGDMSDGGLMDDGGMNPGIEGPTVECFGPAPGSVDFTNAPGDPFFLNIGFADVDDIETLTVDGEVITLGTRNNVSVPQTAEFGIQTFEVTATNEEGGTTDIACSFLFAGAEQDATNTVPGSVVLQLNEDAVDDTVGDDGLDSMNDIIVTALSGGLLEDAIDNRFTGAAGPEIKPSNCDLVDPSAGGTTCVLTTQVEHMANTPGRIDGLLFSNSTGFRLLGVARSVDIAVRASGSERITSSSFGSDPATIGASGSLNTTGTLTISEFGFDIEFRVFRDTMGQLVVERSDVNGAVIDSAVGIFGSLDNSTITAPSFPDVNGESLRSLVEEAAADHITGVNGRSVRESMTESIGDSIAGVLQQLLSTVSVRSVTSSFSVPTVTGGAIDVTFSSGFNDAIAAPDGVTFVLDASYAADPAASVRDLDRMPISTTAVPPANRIQPAAHVIDQNLLNALGFNVWRAGGLNGMIMPGAVEPEAGTTLMLPVEGNSFTWGDVTPPDMASVQLDVRLPPVVRAQSTGLQIQLGEVVATITPDDVAMPGAWPTTQLTIGATFTTSPTGSGITPDWRDFELTDLAVGVDRSLSTEERTNARRYAAFIALHLARHQLIESLPALPIGSFQIPFALDTYGLTGLAVLGTESPSFSVVEGGLEAVGMFGPVR